MILFETVNKCLQYKVVISSLYFIALKLCVTLYKSSANKFNVLRTEIIGKIYDPKNYESGQRRGLE